MHEHIIKHFNSFIEDIKDEEEHEIEEQKYSAMYNLLHSNARILFLSATPKLYGSNAEYAEDCAHMQT